MLASIGERITGKRQGRRTRKETSQARELELTRIEEKLVRVVDESREMVI
jgi:hypothetical protein